MQLSRSCRRILELEKLLQQVCFFIFFFSSFFFFPFFPFLKFFFHRRKNSRNTKIWIKSWNFYFLLLLSRPQQLWNKLSVTSSSFSLPSTFFFFIISFYYLKLGDQLKLMNQMIPSLSFMVVFLSNVQDLQMLPLFSSNASNRFLFPFFKFFFILSTIWKF